MPVDVYERVSQTGGAVRPNRTKAAVIGGVEFIEPHDLSAEVPPALQKVHGDSQPCKIQGRGESRYTGADYEHGQGM
jgi:hypothetical protein